MATIEPVQFNPLLPEVIEDPYPLYHRLRAEDPVHQSPAGMWVLSRYDDVAVALRDPRFGRRGFQELISARFGQAGFGPSMLLQDPPDHTRLRTRKSMSTSRVAFENPARGETILIFPASC